MNTPLRRLIACGLLLGCAAGAAWSAVDVNRADQASLESVKGIGPALSGKLLAERQKAPFRDWSDLIGRVGGVGPGSAQRLSDAGLTVEGKPYAPGGSAAPAAPRPAPARPAASR
ncbi:helix-hairpin-helix domain-containing protein [Piscinibacter sp. Jin2]|uniref:Helix-hairpin-helix domain-containing protein n=1 Tax=Aquariibacter lacus TaxID=2801332 RepID=A0A9X1BQB0_9BURK|nr:helix-hairpin-helix domain-containing protein [Piscinibacter lacus]MBL0719491.1 helix-hairpin-helix domain-containing protein [Piscinibacter lacus]